jgi:hypothetical protein
VGNHQVDTSTHTSVQTIYMHMAMQQGNECIVFFAVHVKG